MKVFVTGATGFIGTAVVKELQQAGHTVVGLARSEASAKKLAEVGVEVVRGDLKDLETLKTAAASSDGVIHLGFVHDFSDYLRSIETDLNAVTAMAEALQGTNKPLVNTTGTLSLEAGPLADEDSPYTTTPLAGRAGTEKALLAFAERGVRAVSIRLPPTVHGEDDHGFIPILIGIARAKGAAAYIGDGSNRWAAVHRTDAARVFRLAFEKAPPGSKLNCVQDQGVPTKDIASLIGRHLGVPVVSKSTEDANEHFGSFFAMVFGMDNPVSSSKTQELLGWKPSGPSLLDDLEGTYYFKA